MFILGTTEPWDSDTSLIHAVENLRALSTLKLLAFQVVECLCRKWYS